MATCHDVDRLVTPYLDGEVSPSDRVAVEQHLKACPPCRVRAAREETARDVLRTHRAALSAPAAPDRLRTRCAAAAHPGVPAAGGSSVRRLVPLSMAAALLLAVAGILGWGLTSDSATVMATQLTLDHLKCFALQPDRSGSADASLLEAKLERRFGWHMRVPTGSRAEHLRLLDVRRCFVAEGATAHILYTHDGRPVSLFLLPNKVRPERVLEVMGHEAAIWSRGGQTYILVAREPQVEMRQIAAYLKNATE